MTFSNSSRRLITSQKRLDQPHDLQNFFVLTRSADDTKSGRNLMLLHKHHRQRSNWSASEVCQSRNTGIREPNDGIELMLFEEGVDRKLVGIKDLLLKSSALRAVDREDGLVVAVSLEVGLRVVFGVGREMSEVLIVSKEPVVMRQTIDSLALAFFLATYQTHSASS